MSDADKQIFRDVYYAISPSLPLPDRKHLTAILNANGGTPIPPASPNLTHFITTTLPSSEPIDPLPQDSNAQLATPAWVESSVLIGLQDTVHYSPDPSMIFSGVIAAATDLDSKDTEVISAGITALGGQWRTALTYQVTHLFALTNGSLKYETAMHYKDQSGVKVLVPHWFDDSVRLGIRGLGTEQYEWPEPKVFKIGWEALLAAGGLTALDDAKKDKEKEKEKEKKVKLSDEKKAFYDTALLAPDLAASSAAKQTTKNVWNGHKILLSSGLELTSSQRTAHEADIKREGGVVVQCGSKEEELHSVDHVDILITRYRAGPVYVQAYKLNKTIGTLPWLWYVRSTGMLSRPMDQLMHYPIPKTPIQGFVNQSITITNYTGKDREYLKRIIATLGGEFTPSMTSKNTVVIAACTGGIKVQKARTWSIPLVNHFWLEDSFSQWRILSLNDPKYTLFPPGVDLSSQIGKRGIKVVYDDAELELLAKESDTTREGGKTKKSRNKDPSGNEGETVDETTGSAREVEEVVGFEVDEVDQDGDVVMDAPAGKRGRKKIEQDVDMEEGDEIDVDEGGKTPRSRRPVSARSKAKTTTPAKSKVATPAKSKAKPKATPKGKEKVAIEISSVEDHDLDEDIGVDIDLTLPKTKTPTKKKPSRPAVTRADEDDGVEVEDEPRPRRLPNAKTKAGKGGRHPEEEEEKEPLPKTPSRKAAMKLRTPLNAKGRKGNAASSKAAVMNVDSDMEDAEVVTGKPATKTKGSKVTHTPARRGRSRSSARKEIVTEGSEDEDEELPKRSLRRRPSKPDIEPESDTDSPVRGRHVVPDTPAGKSSVKSAATGRTLRRHSSQPYVSLPTNKELKMKEREESRSRPSTPVKRVGRTGSTRAEAKDGPSEQPKRGRPPGRAASRNRSKSKSKSRTRRVEAETISPERSPSPSPLPKRGVKSRPPGTPAAKKPIHSTPEAEAGPSKVADTPTTVSIGRSPSRRSAATKASRKLREEVMPDVMSFQKQMKRGVIKNSWEEAGDKSVMQRDDDVNKGKGKGKKRVPAQEEEDEEEEERQWKKRRVSAKGKGKGRGAVDDDDVSMEDEVEMKPPPKAYGKGAGKGPGKSSGKISTRDPKTIRIMTTQVTFGDDVIKAMSKLGVKFTSKPAECTHLVAKSLVRTEKFLCAMAVAPIIVTDKWVQTCIATKHLLIEDDFLLQDPVNEDKFGFKLSEALERAKENGGKLFAGMTFHVTPRIQVDVKLLRNVVNAGGGQVLMQTPTHRILTSNKNRYVISCAADQSIWRPLAESGHLIYNTELVLTGMLRQRIDWESPANRVADSQSR